MLCTCIDINFIRKSDHENQSENLPDRSEAMLITLLHQFLKILKELNLPDWPVKVQFREKAIRTALKM